MLNFNRLAISSLRHYWRTNLATTLGIATAVAVLAGAYSVGASVRSSLRELALSRLGNTQYALISNNFFREKLAPEAPMIALQAVVIHDESGRRASNVSLYAVDQRFYDFNGLAVKEPAPGEVLLSSALARELQADPDDQLLVRIPRISAIPTESLHGRKDDPGRTFRTRMREVVVRDFSLSPTQGEVRAVYFPLARLQREMDLGKRVNTALLPGDIDLKRSYDLQDIGLRLKGDMLQHESMVFSDQLVRAVRSVDPQAQPVYTYLANSMRVGDRSVPYSLVAAVDRPDLPDNTSIILNEWAANDLGAKPGETVELEYYLWDPSGRLTTQSASFRIARIEPVNPADRELAPEYPGISNVESIGDWDPPFPLELGRIRPTDERYWDQYRATPKAYIRLDAGQKLWRTRYGAVTGIRVSDQFDPAKLRAAIDPAQHGLALVNVRQQALKASRGATDFGEYFLYFSFFLIVSALLLAGLFFRFGLEQRANEISTLRAMGYSSSALRRLFLREGLVLAIAGGVVGAIGAALYAWLIVTGLRTWWVDAVGTREIGVHVSPLAIVIALAAAVALVPMIVLLSLRTRRIGRKWWMPHPIIPAVLGGALLFVGGAGGFFGAGALLLIAALVWLRRFLSGPGGSLETVRALGLRYTAHRPGRSVLCVALIASATFLIVAIDSFRRGTAASDTGYRYFAESAIPIYNDAATMQGLPEARWLIFRLRPGEDASCLNLYAPQNPRVLGVPPTFLELQPGTAAVDANTLTYVLHKKVGDSIEVGGASFRIDHALHDSVFQSEVLISDADFQRAYPEEGGYRVFLIDAPPGADATLESALSDYGLDVTTTAERLAAFHRVENTYLSTFQSLGALGLLLGTVGLAAVLLRNVLERRRELALLRAVGYQPHHLATMTLAESLFLLTTGLAIGSVAAMIAVVPTVLQRGGTPPVGSLLLLLAAVLITGTVVSHVAVRVMVRAPLLDALRSE